MLYNIGPSIGFLEHLSPTYVAPQSVTKFIFPKVVIWSHFVVLLKSDLDVQQVASHKK
jgi:hypothetical protein